MPARYRRCRMTCLPRGPWPDAAAGPWSLESAGQRSGLEDDLLAVVLLLLEDVVPVRRLLQRPPGGDHPGGVGRAPLDPLQERLHVALNVALAGPERQCPVH